MRIRPQFSGKAYFHTIASRRRRCSRGWSRTTRGSGRSRVRITVLIESLKLGNVWILVQLIFGPRWPLNQLMKNPNNAWLETSHQIWWMLIESLKFFWTIWRNVSYNVPITLKWCINLGRYRKGVSIKGQIRDITTQFRIPMFVRLRQVLFRWVFIIIFGVVFGSWNFRSATP